jgi:hypothetical protein
MLALQDYDRRIIQLTRESRDIPERKREIESRLNAHREQLEQIRSKLQQQQAGMKELEVEAEAMRQKIIKFREQQYQTKKNEEYRALEKEINNAQGGIAEIEDRELVFMQDIEDLKKQIAEQEQDLKRETELVSQDTSVLDQRLQDIENEIQDARRIRKDLAADIDSAWLRRYERIMKHVGDYAMVPVENSACGGCHMNLPPQLIADAKKQNRLTTCTFCGRLLYHKV